MRKNSAATPCSGHINFVKLRALNTVDPIESRETFVDKRVIRVKDLENAAILADDFLQEPLCLSPHRTAKIVFERGKLPNIRADDVNITELQPLAGEVFYERTGLFVPEHTADLLSKNFRPPQLILMCQLQ